MKEFSVRIPVTAYVEILVEAEDEDEAIDKAFDTATLNDVVEWDLHKKICEGNVCHALLNEIDIIEE
jgi:hypothetical protein